MDPSIVGVLIGSIVSIFGGLIQFLLTWLRDSTHARRDRERKETEWNREVHCRETALLRKVYQNAILRLSVFVHLREPDDCHIIPGSELFEDLKEANKWVAMLYVRHPHPDLREAIAQFRANPYYSAEELLQIVEAMAHAEPTMFVHPPLEDVLLRDRKLRRNERVFKVYIDSEYRKQRLADGIDLQSEVELQVKLKCLTPSQRRALVETFCDRDGILPQKMELCIPVYDEKSSRVALRGKTWNAKVDAGIGQVEPVLAAWENDFSSALRDAQEQEQQRKQHRG